MDPNHLPTQSSSYVGLLNSQQGSVFNENFHYESYHASVNFPESESIPPFSSQQPQQAPVKTPVVRVVRYKWTPADDEVLISAWLNTSKDAIVATDQKSGTFWTRVADYYAATPHGKEDVEREWSHCKKRWHRINDEVNKFCGAYSAAERELRSGESDTDVLKRAHDIYSSNQGHKFTNEQAWCLLRYEQKWMSFNTPKDKAGSKRKNNDPNTQESRPEGFVDAESRPEGIKAAKAKRNAPKGKSVADYASVWEMKKEDLDRQERLSKFAIVDTVLAKTQPLTEAEEIVKNKLLVELF
ncbi:hypothetical protein Bca4012_009798 [Brassica carinata]